MRCHASRDKGRPFETRRPLSPGYPAIVSSLLPTREPQPTWPEGLSPGGRTCITGGNKPEQSTGEHNQDVPQKDDAVVPRSVTSCSLFPDLAGTPSWIGSTHLVLLGLFQTLSPIWPGQGRTGRLEAGHTPHPIKGYPASSVLLIFSSSSSSLSLLSRLLLPLPFPSLSALFPFFPPPDLDPALASASAPPLHRIASHPLTSPSAAMSSVTTAVATTATQTATLSYVAHRHPTPKTGVTSTPSKNLTAVDTNGNVFAAPDYTINDILRAIPKECFNSSLWKSFYFVLRDIFFMLLFGTVAQKWIPQIQSSTLRFLSWTLYVNLMALPMTGLWILAHECGHQAFSKYDYINDFVGWVLHSYCLNPYFSWKFSHRKHHKNNGHLRKDMAYVPPTLDEWKERRGVVTLSELAEDSPLSSIYTLLIQQTVGFQAYLLMDATGQPHPELQDKWYKQFFASHFNPVAPIFDKSNFWFIVMSDIGILLQLSLLYVWAQNFGWFHLFVHWVVPYLLVNHWVVFITYLQHTDMTVPRYTQSQWTFARGAGATIDREFGFVGWFFFHDLIETHVLHHYCGRIPFYNARRATEAIKPVMGKHYRYSNANMFKMLWKALRWCEFVQGDNGVMMFRNHNGYGVPPVDNVAIVAGK